MGDSELDLSDGYAAGLLDGLGWIRLDVSEGLNADTYHVRPELRLPTHGNPYLEGLLFEVLTGFGLDEADLRLADPSQGQAYVAVSRTGAFPTLRDRLAEHSALLVERVAFVAGTLESHARRELSPTETVAYLQAAAEMRHGWTPRSRRMSAVQPETVVDEHGLDGRAIDPLPVPTPAMRAEPSAAYVGGVTDALARLGLSIAEKPGSPAGHSIYPRVDLTRAGVHPQFIRQVETFVTETTGAYEQSGSPTDLQLALNGATSVRDFADAVLDATYATHERLAYLREEILPLFAEEAYRSREGFYAIVRRFEPIYREQGPGQERKYTPAYFEERWADDLDLDLPEE